MNILIYGYNYAPELTGIGKYTGEMAAWLASQGHSVQVITALPHYPDWKVPEAYAGKGFSTETLQGVKVHRLPVYLPGGTTRGMRQRLLLDTSFTFLSAYSWLPVFFAKKFDIVIAVCPTVQAGIFPLLYKLVRGVPWVFHIQDLQVDAAARLNIVRNKAILSMALFLETVFLKKASKVSSISGSMLSRIVAKGVLEKNVVFFANWSDVDFVRPMNRNNPLRERFELSEDELVVLYSGAMGEKQGLEIITEVADLLKDKAGLIFLLVGQGEKRPSLERAARERQLTNVRFADFVSWEDMPSLLAIGDIHLVVQKEEAADLVMPSKLTNILSAGRPVVATASGGTELFDVVNSYETGVTCEPENASALKTALEKLINDPELRLHYGENARTYAKKYLAKDTILKRFESELVQLAESGRR